MKRNCWQVKQCGRQPGGAKVRELGICPAAKEKSCHGINGGRNGGRSCWALAGTLCDQHRQRSFAMKIAECSNCSFYLQVRDEEGTALIEASQKKRSRKAN